MGIPPTPVMRGIASTAIGTDVPTVTMPPAPAETKLQPPAVPETALPM